MLWEGSRIVRALAIGNRATSRVFWINHTINIYSQKNACLFVLPRLQYLIGTCRTTYSSYVTCTYIQVPPIFFKRWSTFESAGAPYSTSHCSIYLLHGLSREAEHLTSHARFPSPKTGVSQPIRRARSIKKFVTSKRVPILGKEPPPQKWFLGQEQMEPYRFRTACAYIYMDRAFYPALTNVCEVRLLYLEYYMYVWSFLFPLFFYVYDCLFGYAAVGR